MRFLLHDFNPISLPWITGAMVLLLLPLADARGDPSDAVNRRNFDDYMEFIRVKLSPPERSCDNTGVSVAEIGWDCSEQAEYQCPLRFDQFCTSISESCEKRHGWPECSGLSADLPRRQDAKVNQAFLKDVRFLYEKTKEDVALMCCRNQEGKRARECTALIKSIPMYVIKNEEFPYVPRDTTVYFSYLRYMAISEFYLYSSGNWEMIQSRFTHELGHACQFAIASLDGKDLELAESSENNIKQSQTAFINVLGTEVSKCLTSKLSAHTRKDEPLGLRLNEAFADAVMAYQARSPYEFAWNCNGQEDLSHASARVYSQCFFDYGIPGHSPLSQKFCPAPKGCLK